jgi:hypothetical protein
MTSVKGVGFFASMVIVFETLVEDVPFRGRPKYPSEVTRMEYLPGARSLRVKLPEAFVNTVDCGVDARVPGVNPSAFSWLAIRVSIEACDIPTSDVVNDCIDSNAEAASGVNVPPDGFGLIKVT